MLIYNKCYRDEKAKANQQQIHGYSMKDEHKTNGSVCPVFGVESSGPIIGLGFLMILLGLIPFGIHQIPFPIPAALVFVGFGFFLIWVGITK